ncbi:MAG: type II secretion system GspH family protein [Muribaculaceae bacterium]|nr:type II secretion system GspH family protein [Muribaculaceae bacterium]
MLSGFTLAETLITLGIIGVVAAITIPNVLNKCRSIVLKNQFKKSVALVNQVIRRTKASTDIETFAEYCIDYSTYSSYINRPRCLNELLSNHNIKSFKPSYYNLLYYNVNRANDTIKSYNGKASATSTDFGNHGFQKALYLTVAMADGQYINYWIENFELYIPVDINGSAKPNRLGHDIFIFSVNKKDDSLQGVQANFTAKEDEPDNWASQTSGNPCNLTSTQKGNGIGCAQYALQDKCPYDSSKTYFECLPK